MCIIIQKKEIQIMIIIIIIIIKKKKTNTHDNKNNNKIHKIRRKHKFFCFYYDVNELSFF